MKLNFDGASRGNLGKLGLGACIDDCHGKLLAFTSSPLPVGTNNLAEAHALFLGLVHKKKGNFQHLHIEGDS